MALEPFFGSHACNFWWKRLVLVFTSKRFSDGVRYTWLSEVVTSTYEWKRSETMCLPGGDISLARARDEMLGASWLVRRVYEGFAITGGLLIDVEVSQEETSRR